MISVALQRSIGAALATAVAAVALFACSSSSSTGTNTGDSVTVGLADSLDALDPLVSDKATQVYKSIFERLVEISSTGELVPGLATSWTANSDSTSWTFTIRPDAKFSDGSPLTMDDVLFSIQAVIDNPKSRSQPFVTPIKSMRASRPNELEFTLKAPFSSWPRQVSVLSIVPQRIYQSLGPVAFAQKPVGSGPYALAGNWNQGDPITLKANPHYWGPKPAFKNVTLTTVVDQTARLQGLQSGSLDLAPLSSQQAKSLGSNQSLKTDSKPGNLVVYLGFNVTVPGLDNLNLRRAVDYAVDRGTLTKQLLQGFADPIGQMVAPVTFGYNKSVEPTPYDPGKAKSLVAQSGYSGQTFVLQYPTDGPIPFPNEVVQAVQGYLTAVGINVKLVGMTASNLSAAWHGKQLQGIYMFSWGPATLDCGTVLAKSYVSAANAYFKDQQSESLVIEQQAEGVPAKRSALVTKLWQLSKEQVLYAPLFNSKNTVGFNSSKLKYIPRADAYMIAQDVRRP
jgi:peptide/nickel transport system substrate-binding protein